MDLKDHPISRIQWMDPNRLEANSYNPNIVQAPEMRLLKVSLLAQGWIQPVLASDEGKERLEVIDGFHRWTLIKTDAEVWAMTDGLLPVVPMVMTVAERMLLTVRINRAKGSHKAMKMHEIVNALHNVHGVSIEDICTGIGADQFEVKTLLAKNVFEHKGVDKTPYSRSWVPDLPHKGNRDE